MRKQVNEIVRIVAESLPKKIKVLETLKINTVKNYENRTFKNSTRP